MDVATSMTEQNNIANRHMKRRNVVGPDNDPAEALKSDTEVRANMPHILFRRVLEEEHEPSD